jgi:hypothetical protein
MKLLFTLLLIPALTYSQQKGDNTIIIPKVTMDQAVKVFMDRGYMIGAATSSVVTTIPKKSPNKITIIFEIQIKDSTGFLQGTYDGKQIVPGLWEHSESYAGHYKGGSFKIMDSLAKSFDQTVTYSKL